MKSALTRLGIRGFKPHLRKAPERLADLRTAEGTGLPANVIEEFRRDMARLALAREQISSIEKTRAERLERAPDTGPHAMVRLLARVIGIGIETADMLVREILSRKLRDRRAVARYAGLTGSPDESGLKRREKGLAKAGNARVRRGLIQLAWRFLMFQKDSALSRSGPQSCEPRAWIDRDRRQPVRPLSRQRHHRALCRSGRVVVDGASGNGREPAVRLLAATLFSFCLIAGGASAAEQTTI